jgi:hypothetical protein
MKYMDIDCYERGCACASSNRVAGEDSEVVEVVKFKELSDEEIDRVVDETYGVPRNPGIYASHRRLARAILKKASEE